MVAHDPFGWLDQQSRTALYAVFAGEMPRGRETLFFRKPPDYLDKDEVQQKHHIVFTSYYPAPVLVKKSAVLRASGRYFTTFLGCCVRQDDEPLRFFDQVYEVQDYKELWAILKTSRVAVVQGFIHPWIFGVLSVATAIASGAKAIIDINDSKLYMDIDPNSFECRLEKSALMQTDGFCHKMPPAAIREMRQLWDLDTPDAPVHCMPFRPLFRHARPLRAGQTPRVVFAGGVMPYHIAKANGHEGHFFFPIIHTLCSKGIDLTFYVNRNARNMYWQEHAPYFNLEKHYPSFHFLPGVPFFELPGLICDYHFGLYYENSLVSSYNPKHFLYNMATKIFSYIEAGLPILVIDTASYIKAFVLRRGLGVTYQPENICDVLRSITPEMHERFRNNARTFRETNDMETMLSRLEGLYGLAPVDIIEGLYEIDVP